MSLFIERVYITYLRPHRWELCCASPWLLYPPHFPRSQCSVELLNQTENQLKCSLSLSRFITSLQVDVKATLCNFYWTTAPSAAIHVKFLMIEKFPGWILMINAEFERFLVQVEECEWKKNHSLYSKSVIHQTHSEAATLRFKKWDCFFK